MIHYGFRIPEEILKLIKQHAKQKGITESDMMRLVIVKGLDQETSMNTKLLLESVCLNRRIAANIDMELLNQAREDAKYMLSQLTSEQELEEFE
jgi:hypothetical protein